MVESRASLQKFKRSSNYVLSLKKKQSLNKRTTLCIEENIANNINKRMSLIKQKEVQEIKAKKEEMNFRRISINFKQVQKFNLHAIEEEERKKSLSEEEVLIEELHLPKVKKINFNGSSVVIPNLYNTLCRNLNVIFI